LTTTTVRIGPSILAADFGRLGDQLAEAEAAGADFVHVDVMDGLFVPNISIGFPILEAVRRATRLPVDVHLMIVEPERYVERFAAAGADSIIVHVEACRHLHGTVQLIEQAGAIPAVALNPATSITALDEIIPFVHQILVMTVNPGFGGQTLIPSMLAKIVRLRALLDERNPTCEIEIDGGITSANIRKAVDAGASMIVAGSSIFRPDASVAVGIASLRAALP
jgi:ribulose-phosphate 3-epimerase